MESRLYEQKLVSHSLFKDLKGNLNDSPGRLRNLLELKDDVLYVWNPVENCLWCLNLKQLQERGDETPYQKLHFLSPPAFAVERVMASSCGSRVCVWGARGVSIAELPSRWGRAGLFHSANNTVLCKSNTLDERFLFSQSEVRRVHWHPSSLSHVLVLVSDNTLRLYNIALKSGPKLVKMFTIGLKPSSLISGRTLLESLGDTAVDFTPLPDSETLLILRGNGDVYMLECELDGKSSGGAVGPLRVFPPADDNYGSESCCLAALGARDSPPLLVIATASAALYHCLLLPNASETEEGDSHSLYVVEAVELNTTDEVLNSYPVHIYPCSSNSYAVVHAGGLHIVTLPILTQLMDYALADEAEMECLLSSVCGARSAARHLVRVTPAAIGLALTPAPLPHALLLSATGDLLARVLEPFDLEEQLYKEMQLKNPALEQDDINAILKERQKVSFTSIIQEILTREVSQPILSIVKRDEPPPKVCLELVSEATLRLRGEYMSRQARAAAALADKLRALAALTDTHRECLQHLQSDVSDVQQQAMTLNQKCMLAEKCQDDLKHRCSAVMRSWGGGARGLSPAERGVMQELQETRRRAADLRERLAHTHSHAAARDHELKKWKEEYKRKDFALGKSHSDTIASVLQQQTSQISSLIEETKLLKDQLSIV